MTLIGSSSSFVPPNGAYKCFWGQGSGSPKFTLGLVCVIRRLCVCLHVCVWFTLLASPSPLSCTTSCWTLVHQSPLSLSLSSSFFSCSGEGSGLSLHHWLFSPKMSHWQKQERIMAGKYCYSVLIFCHCWVFFFFFLLQYLYFCIRRYCVK